jgi:hypothetical protein
MIIIKEDDCRFALSVNFLCTCKCYFVLVIKGKLLTFVEGYSLQF